MNTRTEVMEQVDARRNDAAFMGHLPSLPVLDRAAANDEPTPMFEEVAGEHTEHLLTLLTGSTPSAEQILAAHPRAETVDGS